MQLLGQAAGYYLHKNKDGFIEGFLKKGKRVVNDQNLGSGLSHIVTNCRTVEEFEELMASIKKSSIKPIAPDAPTLF